MNTYYIVLNAGTILRFAIDTPSTPSAKEWSMFHECVTRIANKILQDQGLPQVDPSKMVIENISKLN